MYPVYMPPTPNRLCFYVEFYFKCVFVIIFIFLLMMNTVSYYIFTFFYLLTVKFEFQMMNMTSPMDTRGPHTRRKKKSIKTQARIQTCVLYWCLYVYILHILNLCWYGLRQKMFANRNVCLTRAHVQFTIVLVLGDDDDIIIHHMSHHCIYVYWACSLFSFLLHTSIHSLWYMYDAGYQRIHACVYSYMVAAVKHKQ